MPINFACPRCKQAHVAADLAANTKVRCQSCNQKVMVPTPPELDDKTMAGMLLPPVINNTPSPPRQVNQTVRKAVVPPRQQSQPVSRPHAVQCPDCRQSLQVSERVIGQGVQCPRCNFVFTVPVPVKLEEATAADQLRHAILCILREDARLATLTQPGADAKPAEHAILFGKYCDLAEQLDLSQCPADFRVAYRQHRRAWREVQQAFAQFPNDFLGEVLMGIVNNLVNNEQDGGMGRLRWQAQVAMARTQSTWEEVERAGARYGAAL